MQQSMVNQSKSLACAFFNLETAFEKRALSQSGVTVSVSYSSLQPVNITAGTGKEHLGASYVYEKAWIQTEPVHHGPRHAHSPWAYASADVMPNIGGSIPQRTHRPIKRSKSYHLNISHWIGECFGMFLIPESVCVWIHSSTPMQAYSPTCHAIATTKIAMYSGTVVSVKDRSMQLRRISDTWTI